MEFVSCSSVFLGYFKWNINFVSFNQNHKVLIIVTSFQSLFTDPNAKPQKIKGFSSSSGSGPSNPGPGPGGKRPMGRIGGSDCKYSND